MRHPYRARALAVVAVIAAVVLPILIPAELARTATGGEEELIEGYVVSRVLIPTGRIGRDLTRDGFRVWVEFTDTRSRSTVKVRLNERVLLVFPDGTFRVVRMVGPLAPSGLMFQLQHRDDRRGANDAEHPGRGRRDHGGPLPTMPHGPAGRPYDPYDPDNWSGPAPGAS